jgi:lipopolysaccharide transport system ATP-binding protein
MAVIRAQHVQKTFRVYDRPADRLWEVLTGGVRHRAHTALKDVSFELQPGQALAVLGRNGAGKSTLLKLLMGVLIADQGVLEQHGKITGLLELGTGFDPNLSGLDNIRINGRLLGLDSDRLGELEAEIIAFSELGEYIHAPVRTYSSGMVMRLGFSVAIHTAPACFIVDEALSVGDARFQQKCLNKVQAFKKDGGSILFVSHDLNAVKVLCDQAIVLEGGEVVFAGPPEEACLVYQKILMQFDEAAGCSGVRYGKGAVKIAQVALTRPGEPEACSRFVCGEQALLTVTLSAGEEVGHLSLGLMIRDRLGQDIFGTNTYLQGKTIHCRAGEQWQVSFLLMLNLGVGGYTITLGLHDKEDYTNNVQDWWNGSVVFNVDYPAAPDFVGVCPLPILALEMHIDTHGATQPSLPPAKSKY